jgi:hypothetical protein
MATLADWLLEVDGESFEASWPEAGDVTSPEHDRHRRRGPTKLSVGVTLAEASELKRWTGRPARVLEIHGTEVANIRIEKVDLELKLVVGAILPAADDRRAQQADLPFTLAHPGRPKRQRTHDAEIDFS